MIGALYKDKYGDIWKRIDDYYVKRLKDGNIGSWQNGNGLILVREADK